MKPVNQADLLSSEVPVLPATSWAGLRTAAPVPSSTTPVRTEVTESAVERLITCSPTALGRSTVRSRFSALLRTAGVTSLPWLAKVA